MVEAFMLKKMILPMMTFLNRPYYLYEVDDTDFHKNQSNNQMWVVCCCIIPDSIVFEMILVYETKRLHVVPFLDLDLVFEIEQHELTLLHDLIWDSHNVFMCKLLQYHLITCEKHVAYLYEVEIWSFITSKNYNASLQLETINANVKVWYLLTFLGFTWVLKIVYSTVR